MIVNVEKYINQEVVYGIIQKNVWWITSQLLLQTNINL